jgi:hypothetical protein
MLGESAIVNPETVMDWKSEKLPKIIDVYQLKDMFNVDETGLLYNLQPSKTLTMCAIGSPDRGKNGKILLFIDQCAAHPRGTTALKNIRVKFFPPNCTSHLQLLDMGIIHAFKFQYGKQLIWKAAAMIDGELLGDVSKMMINLLTALHFIAEAQRQISPTTIENCFKKCGFSSAGEYIDVSNDVLNEQEKDDLCSLKPLCMEFDEYVSYDASVSVRKIQSVDQVMQDHLTCVDEEKQEEEVEKEHIEKKVGFLMLFKGQRCQDNTSTSLTWRTTH